MHLPLGSKFSPLICTFSGATIVIASILAGTIAAAIAEPTHESVNDPTSITTPTWRTELTTQLEATPTANTVPANTATSDTSGELQWGNTVLEALIRTSQSPTLQALIQAPTIASNFEQLGDQLSLEIDGKIVAQGHKISTAAGFAVTLAPYFDQATIPQTIVIHSHNKPVFVSHLTSTAQGTEIRSQLLNQPTTVQTFQLPSNGSTARGVLGALSVIGLSPNSAQAINGFIGDLATTPNATPQLAQHFTKLLIDLQGLSNNASPDRINALIASYNRIMKTADSDTVNRLSRNPNFRALSRLLQNLSQSAATQREAIGRTQPKPQPESEEGFVFTGLGAS
jgi:hypothetical protein